MFYLLTTSGAKRLIAVLFGQSTIQNFIRVGSLTLFNLLPGFGSNRTHAAVIKEMTKKNDEINRTEQKGVTAPPTSLITGRV